MKKIAYLSMLFVTLALMSFSCEKEDDPTPNPTNSLYAGVWNTQAIYDATNTQVSIDPNYAVFEFINNGKAYVGNREYPSWTVSGNTITLAQGEFPSKTLTVLIAPTTSSPNNMKLQVDVAGQIYKFELQK